MRKNSRLRAILVIFALSLLPIGRGIAQADAPPEWRVTVENQQAEAREAGLREALTEVLVRLTGRDDIATQTGVSEILAQPSRFVQRYRYQSGGDEGLVLAIRFDIGGVRQALAAQGVAVWSAGRSPVLVWLAIEQGGERLLVGSDEAPRLRAQLESSADRRGVELMFPLLDAEDRRRAGFTDVFGGFSERVRLASTRYGTPLVLMGRVHREGDEWVGRWTLQSDHGETTWIRAAAEMAAALDSGIRELALRLAAGQSVTPIAGSPGADLLLRVSGVDNVGDYARAQQALRGLTGVRDLRPLLFEQDSVVLQLDLELDAQRVLRDLDGGPTFRRESLMPAGAAAAVEYNFRLVP